MREYADVRDTGQTFQVGRRISSMESEARAAGRRIQDVLEATEPGSRFGARRILSAARELGADVLHDGRTLANGAEALGEATASMSVEMEKAEWESTGMLTRNNGLFRSVNAELTGLATPDPANASVTGWSAAPATGTAGGGTTWGTIVDGPGGSQGGGPAVDAPADAPAPPAGHGDDDPDVVTAVLHDGSQDGPYTAHLRDLGGLTVEQAAQQLHDRT